MNKITRRQAIIRRRIFIACAALFLALVIIIVAVSVSAIKKAADKNNESSAPQSGTDTVSDTSSENGGTMSSDNSSTASQPESSTPQSSSTQNSSTSKPLNTNLDPEFTNLLLVNADNPLPDDYDTNVRKDLVTIDKKYRNNDYVTDIHKDVYPYITAMVAAAQAEGVDLRVWSPFRSYAIQKDLFQKQVNRVGGDEEKAATVVARPGTSEHNTGLCADFNMASDSFANTKMYTWMVNNAEDYGFIMRYSAEKKPITGVIHESWHWRFVGINAAKEMNRLGMCLEEYVEYKNK